eukprot:jgi/Bigna1/145283/aug1.97_g19991
MSVSQFLGKDDWKVSVQDGGTYLVYGNQTSNKAQNVSEKVKALENYLKCWKENLKHELKKREEDMTKCETQLMKLENEIEDGDSDEGENDEGLDGECEEQVLIREIVTQRNILGKHRRKIKEITDMLEGRKVCSKHRDAQELVDGKKSCRVAFKLTMEQYAFKHIDTKFVLKYKFNDGKISVASQLRDESVVVDGMSFTGHSIHTLRKCGDKATLIAVAQAEIQLSNSLQTAYDKTAEEITRLRNEYEETDINDEERQHKLVAEELKRKRLLGRMKKGKHKAEMLVSAYVVERLGNLIVDESVDINIRQLQLAQQERELKLLEMGWRKLPDMRTERVGLDVVVGDGKLFAVGGWDGSNHLIIGEYLDLKNVNAGWKELPDMGTKRSHLGVAVGDGKLFAVGGGYDIKSGEYLDLKNMDAGWKELPDMRIERAHLGVAVGDGKLFAVGGSDKVYKNLKSGEYLDLKDVDAGWKELPDMRIERAALSVAVGDGKLFAVGGYGDDGHHKSGEYLDLKDVDAGWKELPAMMNITRIHLGVAVGDSKLFAVGGRDGRANYLTSGEYLDLKNASARWKELPDMNVERDELGVAVGDGKLFAVGGYDGSNCHKSGECLRIAM